MYTYFHIYLYISLYYIYIIAILKIWEPGIIIHPFIFLKPTDVRPTRALSASLNLRKA